MSPTSHTLLLPQLSLIPTVPACLPSAQSLCFQGSLISTISWNPASTTSRWSLYSLDACLHHSFWLSLHSFHILLISCMCHSKHHTFLELRCCVWYFIPSFIDEDINIYSNKDLWNWMEFSIVTLTLWSGLEIIALAHMLKIDTTQNHLVERMLSEKPL